MFNTLVFLLTTKPVLHGPELPVSNVNVTVESKAESEVVHGLVSTDYDAEIKLNQCHLHKVNWTTWHETSIFQRSPPSTDALIYERKVYWHQPQHSTTRGWNHKIFHAWWSVFTGLLPQYCWPHRSIGCDAYCYGRETLLTRPTEVSRQSFYSTEPWKAFRLFQLWGTTVVDLWRS